MTLIPSEHLYSIFSFIRKVHTQPTLPVSLLGSACIQHLLLSSFLCFYHLNEFLGGNKVVAVRTLSLEPGAAPEWRGGTGLEPQCSDSKAEAALAYTVRPCPQTNKRTALQLLKSPTARDKVYKVGLLSLIILVPPTIMILKSALYHSVNRQIRTPSNVI